MTRCEACLLLAVIMGLSSAAPGDEQEDQLIKVLHSDAPQQAKDSACEKLKLIGTAKAVPALAPLLEDQALSHSARYALEAIDSAEAAGALREALSRTNGPTRAGIIHSLGQRRDKPSVDVLKALVRDDDARVAAAAVVALGRVGGAEAVGALRAVRSAGEKSLAPLVLDAMLACADSMGAGGYGQDAARIYREVHNDDDAPEPARTAAYRGLVLTAGDDAFALIEKGLTGEDRAAIIASLRLVREAPAIAAVDAAALLSKLMPELRIAVIEGLSQRGDASAMPGIVSLARDVQQPEAVRAAAIRALGAVADASVVPLLATAAAGSTGALQDAARQSLARLKGDGVRDAILAHIDQAEVPMRVELIRALGQRYERGASTKLLKLTDETDDVVRDAALQSLSLVADDSMIAPLVRMLARCTSNERRSALERTLRATASRAADRSAAARTIAVGLAVADPAAAGPLLRVAAVIDDPSSLAALRDATRSIDAAVADDAVRALASSANPAAAQDLLNIAKDGARSDDQRVFALRGVVRLADEGTSPPEARVELLKSALANAWRLEEKRLVLATLARIHTVESLRVAEALVNDPAVAQEAVLACLQVARALLATHPSEARSACETIIASAPGEKAAADARSLLHKINGK